MSEPTYKSPFKFASKKHWLERCEAWNWNCNLAEIASELIDGGIHPRTKEFEKFTEALQETFKTPDSDIETIENMLDVFGGF